MFCNQCEQTAHGIGCTLSPGVCGKDADVQSVQELILYGLKGMAAYASHARRLGKSDPTVSAFIEEALFSTMTNVNFDLPSLLEIALDLGRHNLRVMELLDAGHVDSFGKPSPAVVTRGTKPGPGILVTGHDLLDLWNLLRQVEGSDIQVYTHGEMLPAFMYPRLREHPNLAGHYGGPWQKQKSEFADFPGPIVATTNCILIPRPEYADRLFTTRFTAVPGGTRLKDDDFSPVIAKARACPPLTRQIHGSFEVGYHRTVLLDAAPTLIDAIRAGQIRRFFVIGGCDGAEPGRNYFKDYAEATPPDSFILTLGCGKYRINDHDYGTLLGLPRLLDMGQCNDAYGAIQVALALANAFGCSVNQLPLTLVISWFEQKAVAVLLTLLSLGVKGIRLGPKPPGFLTPNVFKLLKHQFDLGLIGSDAHADLAAALA
ncbi:MAG: hydroxylamine reductase [Isosphaeraceae bacterium]|jgi:hydroxylamine reductase|nr:MAG: hydroxylamine reductase [Isosphaeraceae bacterium]